MPERAVAAYFSEDMRSGLRAIAPGQSDLAELKFELLP